MNVDDLVRASLLELGEEVSVSPDLYSVAVRRGRRHRTVRRAAAASGAALSVATIATTGVVLADNTGGGHHAIQYADGTSQVVSDPWWQTWTADRHYNAISPAFLDAARPQYDAGEEPEQITVFAAGTLPDGTQWTMFTDQSNPHQMQWLQGWNDHPDFGESSGQITPEATWTTWSVPTRASHDGSTNVEEWLIVVGRPGTTEIDYSPDGTTWQPMDINQGIAVMKITTPTGFPSAAAQVRLADATGIYATGAPAGAGADANPTASPTPGDGVTPTATPTAADG